jgi:hypothetical protein
VTVPHSDLHVSFCRGMTTSYEDGIGSSSKDENLLDLDGDEPLSAMGMQQTPSASPTKQQKSNIDDLLDIMGDIGGGVGGNGFGAASGIDTFGTGFGSPTQPSRTLLLSSGKCLLEGSIWRPSLNGTHLQGTAKDWKSAATCDKVLFHLSSHSAIVAAYPSLSLRSSLTRTGRFCLL